MSRLVYQTYNGYVLSQFKKLQADIRSTGDVRWKHVMHLLRLFAGQPVTAHNVRAATDRVGELAALAADGSLKIEVEVLPLEWAAEAIHRQSTRGNRGKLVLAVER